MSNLENNSKICNGIVKWFDHIKGYGFIELDDGRDVHVHFSVVPGLRGMCYLLTGDEVEIVVGERENGYYVRSMLKYTRSV